MPVPPCLRPLLSHASALDIPSSVASFVPSLSASVPLLCLSLFFFFTSLSLSLSLFPRQCDPFGVVATGVTLVGPQAVHERTHEELRGLTRVYDRVHERMCYCAFDTLDDAPRCCESTIYRSLFRAKEIGWPRNAEYYRYISIDMAGPGSQFLSVSHYTREHWPRCRVFFIFFQNVYAYVYACILGKFKFVENEPIKLDKMHQVIP